MPIGGNIKRKQCDYILGIDPGLANCGWAVVSLPSGRLLDGGVVLTEKSDKKHKVAAPDDTYDRARIVARTFLHIRNIYGVPKLICIEAFSYPRNAVATAQLGMCWGIVAMFTSLYDVPLISVTPQTLKRELTGQKKPSDQQIRDVVVKWFPDVKPLAVPYKSNCQHLYDAAGAIIALWDSQLLTLVRNRP